MLTARPTTYNGIRMRSRLEARYAALLDLWFDAWEYEPRAFANQRGQYLPDFMIPALDDLPNVYIEVRPHLEGMALALDRMQIIWDSEPDAFLISTAPGVPFQWFASGRGSRCWHMVHELNWA